MRPCHSLYQALGLGGGDAKPHHNQLVYCHYPKGKFWSLSSGAVGLTCISHTAPSKEVATGSHGHSDKLGALQRSAFQGHALETLSWIGNLALPLATCVALGKLTSLSLGSFVGDVGIIIPKLTGLMRRCVDFTRAKAQFRAHRGQQSTEGGCDFSQNSTCGDLPCTNSCLLTEYQVCARACSKQRGCV